MIDLKIAEARNVSHETLLLVFIFDLTGHISIIHINNGNFINQL